MLGRFFGIALGLWIVGILPVSLPAGWAENLVAFLGRDWVDFAARYGLADLWGQARPWIGWGLVAINLLALRGVLLWPLRNLYWLRRLFGGRIFGQARWAKRRDLAKAGMLESGGLFLGSLRGRDFFHNGEGHLLTLGGVGGGKSSGLVVPTLLTLQEGSVVVTDPSGELAAMTARRRAEIGPVVFFSPFSELFEQETGLQFEDAGFNPLSVLDPASSTFFADVGAFARLLMVTDRRESGSYFNDEGAEFIALMIAAIKLYDAPDLHTLPFLYQVVRDSTEAMKWRLEMIVQQGNPAIMDEAQRFLSIIETSPPQWAGIISKAGLATRRYAPTTPLGVHTSKGSFDAMRLRREKITVYLLVPSAMLAFSLPWLNLLVGVFGTIIGRPGPRAPITLLIDEAPALGYLPDLRDHMRQYRKAGLRVWLFTQTYAALSGPELYGDAGMKDIFGLTTIKQFFAVEEPEVQKMVSELCGMRSVSNPSTQGGMGDVGRPLITPEEVRGLPKWHQIIIRGQAIFPIKGKLTPYFTRKNWRGMVDPNPYRGG